MTVRLEPVIAAYRCFFDGGGRPKRLVVDAGSRDGDDAAELVAALGPGTRGIAIEARADAVEAIRERHPSLTTIHGAVHDQEGTTGFAVLESDDPGIQGSSSLRFERSWALGVPAHVVEVPCFRLDSLLADEPIIDILKVDVEGFTPEALDGLGERLADVLVAHLETETFHRELEPWLEKATNARVAKTMRAGGFVLVEVSYEWGPSIEDQLWVNADRTEFPKGHLEPVILLP